MGDGVAQKDPVARILQETWNPDGTISGIRLERRGRIYREVAYTGRYRSLTLCRAGIERSYDSRISTSQAVLDASGSPRYSLGTLPDVVVASRWFTQGSGACRASLLDGTVLSMQQGRNWKDGLWRPNAVIQKERWRAGSVLGQQVLVTGCGPIGSLLIAALSAEGQSVIHNIHQIDRGYQDIEQRLKSVGARIERVA
jgi:hypothetical protein